MYRMILFKAKDRKDGKWVEGLLSKCDNQYTICDDSGIGIFVDETTICQYTGHEDDNENKIFENDLIECKEYSNGQLKKHFISQVEWDYVATGFTFKDAVFSWAFMDALTVYECKVVGNVFDNSELMNENGGLN